VSRELPDLQVLLAHAATEDRQEPLDPRDQEDQGESQGHLAHQAKMEQQALAEPKEREDL